MYMNAHCHLELSALKGLIPKGLPFVEWLARLLPLKRSLAVDQATEAARAGLQRMVDTGTTVLLDTLSLDFTAPLLNPPPAGMQTLSFFEIIDFSPETGEASVNDALARQQAVGEWPPQQAAAGFSPHAPYSTTPSLLRAAMRHARQRRQWLCIHAAETPEETRLMVHGTGPLREALQPILSSDWRAPALRPVEFLDACGCLGPRTLLAHLNDITDSDIAIIARRGCSAVVCPGSHVYFNRGPFPLTRLLDADIPVYLGTDSLASNEDLDMEREINLALELSRGLTYDRIRSLALAERAENFFH